MVIRTGIIGVSEGNGHPFSFSAIVNGYDDAGFGAAGWPVIHEYLKRQPPENFGFPGVAVTHAWTQHAATTRALAAACRIPTVCEQPADMLGSVDAVIVARDDWESHAPLAREFLAQGVCVFIDKPLTLDARELREFEPHLRSGRLMSCSGLRHARELDGLRADVGTGAYADVRMIGATVLNGIEKYGIHMLEAVASLGNGFERVVEITRLHAPHPSYSMRLANGAQLLLNCLGDVGKTFHLSFFARSGHRHFDLHDNFGAFRATLARFFAMVRTHEPPIVPDETLSTVALVARAARLEPGETIDWKGWSPND